eukprot:1196163-Prorocentrum_minimum.AAC.3
MRGTNVQNASYQRCEHPGFPGASSVCNVLVPWTNPSPVQSTGVQCGTAKGPFGLHSSDPMTVKALVSGVCRGSGEGQARAGATKPFHARRLFRELENSFI